LPLARRAVELDAGNSTYHNSLGVALYRAGQHPDALASLETSLKESNGATDAFDHYFLAMCHHHLSDPMKAKDHFDQAIRWQESKKASLPEVWQEELA